MAEIDEEIVFVVKTDGLKFTTQTNGDMLIITGLEFSKEQAASLAWLVNSTNNLVVEIKLQG